jgi:hypothetical protein
VEDSVAGSVEGGSLCHLALKEQCNWGKLSCNWCAAKNEHVNKGSWGSAEQSIP